LEENKMIGNAIPELRHSRLMKLISLFMMDPALILTKLFGSPTQAESDTIKWEAQIGNRGMAPFANEDAEAPQTTPGGISKHEAVAAFWKEKIFLGASFLNNIRQPGTIQKENASKYLARQAKMLRNRNDRRKEWMYSKMLTAGAFSYLGVEGQKTSVDYGIPAANKIVLSSTRKWNGGTAKNILEDIMDIRITASRKNGAELDYAICTDEVLKLMILDSSIQTLLAKSQYGQGDLFNNPTTVLSHLLNLTTIIRYNDVYQVRSWLTQALAAGAGPHTIYVEDPTDFEVGATLYAVSSDPAVGQAPEAVTITGVSTANSSITATGTLSYSYKAGRDAVYVNQPFVPTTKFTMFSSKVEGNSIAEFVEAPFALTGNYGMLVDTKENYDPDGIFIRAQNKGLPVLYNQDAVYPMTVVV
jgi:hypothetical protein